MEGDCGLWIADCGLRIADCGEWRVESGEWRVENGASRGAMTGTFEEEDGTRGGFGV
jgi:hypothetical protein